VCEVGRFVRGTSVWGERIGVRETEWRDKNGGMTDRGKARGRTRERPGNDVPVFSRKPILFCSRDKYNTPGPAESRPSFVIRPARADGHHQEASAELLFAARLPHLPQALPRTTTRAYGLTEYTPVPKYLHLLTFIDHI
jgi:hypothetical protein